MYQHLLTEINNFRFWAKGYTAVPEDERFGEWETDYPNWDKIYFQFNYFLKTADCTKWDDEIKDQLLYIIARDNEAELLADALKENKEALILLARHAVTKAPVDAKWQIAVQLKNMGNKILAIQLLEAFSEDEDEYVSRRALAELKALY